MRSAKVAVYLGMCLVSSTAFASGPWTATLTVLGRDYAAPQTYPNKQQAVAAMQALDPPTGVVATQESIYAMSSSSVTYQYVAPTIDQSFTPWVFIWYGAGPGGPNFTSESAAVSAYIAAEEEGQTGNGIWCGTPTYTASPIDSWSALSGGPDYTQEGRNYSGPLSGNAPPNNCQAYTYPEPIQFSILEQRIGSFPAGYYCAAAPDQPTCNNAGEIGYVTGPLLECADNGSASPQVGDPCDVSTGDLSQSEMDYSAAGLTFSRYYHSSVLESGHALGVGWTHNYAAYLVINNAVPVGLLRPDGHHDAIQIINGEYISLSGAGVHIVASGSNWVAYMGNGSSEVYNSTGQLIQKITASGLVTTLAYNANNQLASVTGPFGHSLQFAYGASGQMATVTEPDGTSTISYAYDVNENLISATYPDSSARQYLYQNTAFPNNLTGILDELNSQFLTVQYDPTTGAVVSSQQASGAQAVSIAYGTNSAVVTDSLAATNTYAFTNDPSYAPRVTSLTRNTLTQTFAVPAGATDAQRRVTQSTDANGNITTYSYNADHLLSKTEASGTPQARTTTYQYLGATTALPTLVTEALRQTTYSYESGTNLVQAKTMTSTMATPNISRTWSYTYDSYGRISTVDGPRTDVSDVTTYSYYTCATGAQCGQVETVTNAIGQVTTYNTYNAHGQLLTSTDPNGVVTTLTYDARQRLTSRQIGSEATSLAYYLTGLLQKVTLPDSSLLQSTYDGAHRLTQLSDGAGNSIHYTLDTMGNRIAESAYDPSNTLSRTRSRVYNSLNELAEEIGAAGTTAVTTSYGDDNNGNQTTINAPLSRNAVESYDALNRVQQITDPGSGNTYMAYDANDDLTALQDPTGIITSYTFDGLGDLLQQVSPSTGTTTNTYDSGGNLASSLDARGKTASYSYDALNRVTQIAYGDQTISYGYDAGTYGKGHLTTASDSAHALTWLYDALGRVVQKSQVVAGVTKSVAYAYTGGDLTTLTTPSGQSVTYSYSDHQVSSITVNGTTLLSNVTYEPFGPSRGWSWGSGTAEIRLHDTDGNPTLITGSESTNYTVDSAFRITAISNSSNSVLSWIYGYDTLDRLTGASASSAALTWTYDADGNRLSQGGGPSMTANASALVYNNRGRLVSATTSTGAAASVYNALGQRIEKINSLSAFLYVYDESGHLLGEYSSTGALIQETIWLGDIPVATLQPNGAGGISVYYIHSDHLNTPKTITRSSDGAIVWRWDQDPFGTAVPNQNPSGIGSFSYNPRFPGQYYDVETGLNYNYSRDYDSQIGRYIESDPTGLKGGNNTYAYARSNPEQLIDPTGETAWHGQSMAYGVVAGIGMTFTKYFLTSDCENGKIASATVYAVGPAAGADIEGAPPVSGSYDEEVNFNDNMTTPDPNVFDGSYISFNAGFVTGTGGAAHATKLGGATFSGPGPSSYQGGWSYGLELGASVTAGTSTVMSSSVSACGCNSSN
jgi:RHS repeat-associated protein